VRASRFERGEGPSLFVFGRLAEGVTVEQAQTELAAFGRRAAEAYPATNARLRPRVLPYTYPLTGIRDSTRLEFSLAQFLVTLLLAVVAVNVAVLVYARTAMRRGEIAIRSALGATRGRIVGQLFIEALLLSGGAALLGLVVVQVVLNKPSISCGGSRRWTPASGWITGSSLPRLSTQLDLRSWLP
jgi:putative ABC transport system permease protein